MYDNEYTQKEVKFQPRIKLNHIICIMYAVKLRKQWKDGKSCPLRICCLGPTRKSSLFGINLLFTINLHISPNTPCPPNFCITLVFYSPWVLQWSQKKLKRMLVQNFGGQTRCIMGGVQMVNWPRLFGQDGWIMALFFFLFLLSWLLQRTWFIKMRIKRTLANIQPCWLHERLVTPSSNIELFMSQIIPIFMPTKMVHVRQLIQMSYDVRWCTMLTRENTLW